MSDPRHAYLDRWYRRNYRFDGEDVLSVTTINKAMYSYNLENWKIRRAVDYTLSSVLKEHKVVHLHSEPDEKGLRLRSGVVEEIMRALAKPTQEAKQGIGVHEALESWFTTGRIPDSVDDAEAPFIEQAIRWAMERNPRPVYLEPEVYSAEHKYAGSVDAIFEIDDQLVLIDYKTGGVFESAAMQLAAYQRADRLYPRTAETPCAVIEGGECQCEWVPMPAADRLAVLDLKADTYELRWVTPIADGLAWQAFQGCLSQQRLKREKQLFVPARPPVKEEAA